MSDDFIQWERLLLHVYDELTVYEDPYRAERQAVQLYTEIHRQWVQRNGEP